MDIAIIGAGAMGSLFGAVLARGGHRVWMIDNHPERARIVEHKGIRVEGISGSFSARVNATADPTSVPAPEFIFIFVKAYDTAAAADTAAGLASGDATIVTLQNGLGNIETLAERFGAGRVIGGATAHGATEIGPGHIRHAGAGATVIGAAPGAGVARVKMLAEMLRGAGIDVEVSDDLDSVIWSKLVVNCGINAVGALTRLPNGGLIEDPGAAQVLRAAAREAAAIARAKGIRLQYENAEEHAQQVCRATADNLNSMLQDVLRRRRTEVEAINGAVARAGAEIGVEAPVNAALAALVGAVERGYGRRLECGGSPPL